MRPPGGGGSRLLQALIGVWLLVVLVATLSPGVGPGTSAGPAPLADALRNLVLFAPLGLLLGLQGRPLLWAPLLGALLSTAIEIAQLGIPGRFASVRDVVTNTLGAASGAAVARALVGPAFRSATRSARIALAAGGLVAAVLLLPGLLLRPAPPESLYHVAWAPILPRSHYVPFPGRVLDARIGTVPIESAGSSERSGALREQLLDGGPVAVRAASRGHTPGIAPLVRINDLSREILLVGVQGEDVVVRAHAIAGDLGLEEPLFSLPGALSDVVPGAPFAIELTPLGAAWLVSAGDSDPRLIGPTSAAMWRLIADSDAFPEPFRRVLDALALMLAFGTIAVWFRPRWPAVAGLSLALAALLGGPRVAGLVPAPPSEWSAVAMGLVGGALLQAWIRRGAAARTTAPPGLPRNRAR